jgi:hypothetical protein
MAEAAVVALDEADSLLTLAGFTGCEWLGMTRARGCFIGMPKCGFCTGVHYRPTFRRTQRRCKQRLCDGLGLVGTGYFPFSLISPFRVELS